MSRLCVVCSGWVQLLLLAPTSTLQRFYDRFDFASPAAGRSWLVLCNDDACAALIDALVERGRVDTARVVVAVMRRLKRQISQDVMTSVYPQPLQLFRCVSIAVFGLL